MKEGNKISLSTLEEMVKEVMVRKMKEHDVLYKKKKAWQEAKEELKSDMGELLDNMENDDYRDGVDKIDSVISSLKSWKNKIQKNI